MSRLFGWSYPPGCSGPPEWDDTPCDCCGIRSCDCECPECSVCSEQGNPNCYKAEKEGGHGMKYNKQQRIGQTLLRIDNLKGEIDCEQMYIDWLKDQPDNWKDE